MPEARVDVMKYACAKGLLLADIAYCREVIQAFGPAVQQARCASY